MSTSEYLIALNISGIKTDKYDDLNKSGKLGGEFSKFGIDLSPFKDIFKSHRRNVPMKTIVNILLDAKKILSKSNLLVDQKTKEDNKRFFESISQTHTLAYILEKSHMSKRDKLQYVDDVLRSIDPNDLSSFYPFKMESSGKNSKLVKELKYSDKEFKDFSTLNALKDTIEDIADTPEEFLQHLKKMPYFSQGLFSEDVEYFEACFIQNWCISGGSTAQIFANRSFSDALVNSKLNDFWVSDKRNENIYVQAIGTETAVETAKDHLSSLYEKNKKYYKDKYKKNYETKTIKLYRGIGETGVDSYIPGALESWTTNISTAVNFAKMMAPSTYKYGKYVPGTGTVLTAEVPIRDIFGSWDSFDDVWPGEEDLKGKKEYIVMGGTFSTTPLYVVDMRTKTPENQLKTFKEWTYYGMNESKSTEALKIITPSMKDFKTIMKSGKAALGNDPKENEVRKKDD